MKPELQWTWELCCHLLLPLVELFIPRFWSIHFSSPLWSLPNSLLRRVLVFPYHWEWRGQSQDTKYQFPIHTITNSMWACLHYIWVKFSGSQLSRRMSPSPSHKCSFSCQKCGSLQLLWPASSQSTSVVFTIRQIRRLCCVSKLYKTRS